MGRLDEIVEAYVSLALELGEKPNADDIAGDAADNALAQGVITVDQVEQAVFDARNIAISMGARR